MKDRLKQFLLAENINQTRAAELIGVTPAALSHILSGRSNPGYDFLQAFAQKFPNISLEWLLLGLGKMYKSSDSPTVQKSDSREDVLEQKVAEIPSPEPLVNDFDRLSDVVEISPKTQVTQNLPSNEAKKVKVKKIILLYEDNSYQVL